MSPPRWRAAGMASSGSAKSSRQKPVAAGPAADRRTRIGARPITQAPMTSIITARARPSGISEFYRLGHNAPESEDSGGTDMKQSIIAAALAGVVASVASGH